MQEDELSDRLSQMQKSGKEEAISRDEERELIDQCKRWWESPAGREAIKNAISSDQRFNDSP